MTPPRFVMCQAIPVGWVRTEEWQRRNNPKCNRVAGHEGPHRQYNADNFAVLLEWENEEER